MSEQQPPGWYPAQGDPPGTVRWWDGTKWVGGPQAMTAQQTAGYVAPTDGMLPNGKILADAWTRIGAAVIDIIFIGIVIALIVVALIGGDLVQAGDIGSGTEFGAAIVGGALGLAYRLVPMFMWSATIGKKVVGIQVVDVDGKPLGTEQVIRREANQIVLTALGVIPVVAAIVILPQLVIGVMSLVFLFNDAGRQTVMDRFAKTNVVKAKG